MQMSMPAFRDAGQQDHAIFAMWWLMLAAARVDLATYTNEPFIDFFFNWHAHYTKLGLPYNLTVYALDDAAFVHLKREGIGAVRWSATHRKALRWGTKDYKRFVNEKPSILRHHAKFMAKGDVLVWFDADSVWFSDPLAHLGSCSIATQMEKTPNIYDYCTGFIMMRISEAVDSVLKRWLDTLSVTMRKGQDEQRAFNLIAPIYKPCQLPSEKFPSGNYFNRLPKDMVIFHNNFVAGHERKLERFKQKGFWWL